MRNVPLRVVGGVQVTLNITVVSEPSSREEFICSCSMGVGAGGSERKEGRKSTFVGTCGVHQSIKFLHYLKTMLTILVCWADSGDKRPTSGPSVRTQRHAVVGVGVETYNDLSSVLCPQTTVGAGDVCTRCSRRVEDGGEGVVSQLGGRGHTMIRGPVAGVVLSLAAGVAYSVACSDAIVTHWGSPCDLQGCGVEVAHSEVLWGSGHCRETVEERGMRWEEREGEKKA